MSVLDPTRAELVQWLSQLGPAHSSEEHMFAAELILNAFQQKADALKIVSREVVELREFKRKVESQLGGSVARALTEPAPIVQAPGRPATLVPCRLVKPE